MRRSILWVAFSIALTLEILLVSNLLKPSSGWENLQADLTVIEEPVLLAEEADSTAEVALTVTVPKQSETLSFSSQAEVFRFQLNSQGAYTLRYLTLLAYPEGLKPITEWTIYEEVDGQTDFTKPVALSEKTKDNLVRFRFSGSPSSGIISEPGTHTFVVYAAVLNDPNSTQAPKLTLAFPETLAQEWDFAWLPGRHHEAWFTVEESLGIAEFAGLPTQAVRKY